MPITFSQTLARCSANAPLKVKQSRARVLFVVCGGVARGETVLALIEKRSGLLSA